MGILPNQSFPFPSTKATSFPTRNSQLAKSYHFYAYNKHSIDSGGIAPSSAVPVITIQFPHPLLRFIHVIKNGNA